MALDASRPALKRAARAHPRIAAVACDVWHGLPLEDQTADLMINVFAPRKPAEMLRVLAPGGTLIVVTPTERHLHEVQLLRVHPGKSERLHAAFSPPQSARLLEFVMELDQPDVEALIAMGPSAHHRRRSPRAARVTASVVNETYRG